VAAGLEIRDAHYPGRAPVDAYGNGGFRFAGMSHRGGILCLPSGVYGWDSSAPGTLDEAALAKVIAEAAEIEILIVGTGNTGILLGAPLRGKLRDAGIVAETMSTGAAVRTFNVLLAEERSVAAALIPVD
jgi:uncharacterized protein